jgi:hypothetical protein
MRKLALMAVLASTAMAGPALAKDKAWYAGIEGGGMILEDLNFDIAGVSNVATANAKTGYDVDGIVGYDFGMFRMEGEVGYKHDRITSYSTTAARTPANIGGVGAPPGTYNDASGKN